MFHSFLVQEHRDLLRFFWYKDKDPNRELAEYRMKVYVFGNTSAPAVATFCLRNTANVGKQEFGSDAKDLEHNHFYVDDWLKCVASPAEAIDLLARTRAILATANLCLHKTASSHPEVTCALPRENQASALRDLDFSIDTVPVERALGCCGTYQQTQSPSKSLWGRSHLQDEACSPSLIVCSIHWDLQLQLLLEGSSFLDP